MIDLHNHIMRYVVPVHRTEPHIETAVRMARMSSEDGVRVIVSTPHFRPAALGERLPEVVELLQTGLPRLNAVLAERGIDVEVVGGAEVELCEDLPDLASRDLLPTLGEGHHVMIELPIASYAAYAEQVLFELQLKGYTPVLAHFERMATSPAREAEAEALVSRGMKLQINCESLQGKRGRDVQRMAQKLIRDGLASALGSDAHDVEDRPPRISPCRRAVERAGGRGTFERLTREEPLAIIGRA